MVRVHFPEDVKEYSRQLVGVWHFGVGQDGHHPRAVVYGLRGSDGVDESLAFQQIRLVRVVADQILERKSRIHRTIAYFPILSNIIKHIQYYVNQLH